MSCCGGSALAPERQISDWGAIYTAEAVLAALLIVFTVATILYVQPGSPGQSPADLRGLSGDLLNVLEYRENLPSHPNLAAVVTSRADWEARAPLLEEDIRDALPDGTRFYLVTPFGAAGDPPPAKAPRYVRAFEAFVAESGEVRECQLILWRG